MRPVIRRRVWPFVFDFLSPFGRRRSLLGRPVPATDVRSPYGRPTIGRSLRWTVAGFPCSALLRCDRYRVPPYTPGPWCSHGRHRNFSHHRRFSATCPVLRLFLPPIGALANEACRGSRCSPLSGLSLACDQRGEHRFLGFLPGFTPRRYQQRMPGAGTGIEHLPGTNRRSFTTLHSVTHSHSATSCRTSIHQ
jgi:hypothetical protein